MYGVGSKGTRNRRIAMGITLSSTKCNAGHQHRRLPGASAICLCACAVGLAFISPVQVWGQQSASQGTETIMMPPRPTSILLPAANHMPDANDTMQINQQAKQSKQARFEAANTARRKQIADDAAKLLELASELKTAVDKTDKDTLSLDVIHKAESIERLAKGVKEKMKLTGGAS